MSKDDDQSGRDEIQGLTLKEGAIIRAVEAIHDWKDVCGWGQIALGRELTASEAQACGTRASILWRRVTGLKHPPYGMMPKRSSGKLYPAHLKGVYPPSWGGRVMDLIRRTVESNAVANGFVEYDRSESTNPLEGTSLYEMFKGE